MVSLDDFLHGVGCSPTTRWLLCKILRQFFVGKGISPEDTDLLIAHMSTFTDMKRLNRIEMLSWLNYATFFGLGLTAYPLLSGQLYIYGCICFLSFYSGVVVGPVRRHYFWRFPERIRDRRTVGSVLRVTFV